MPEQETCLGRGLSLFLVFPFKTPLLSSLPSERYLQLGVERKKMGPSSNAPANPEYVAKL